MSTWNKLAWELADHQLGSLKKYSRAAGERSQVKNVEAIGNKKTSTTQLLGAHHVSLLIMINDS